MAFIPAPPTPDRADKLTFPSRMYNWFTWFVATIAELSTLGSAYNLATSTTSVTSNSLDSGIPGDKTFTVAAGLGFVPGMPLNCAHTAIPTNSMFGFVKTYVGTTLVMTSQSKLGSGTFASWTISLAATQSGASLTNNIFTGLQRWFAGANIASAATVDLTAATGNTINITGTVATSAFTLTAGQWMLLIPTGAWPLTYHATNCNINGGRSYTCQAGDRVYIGKDAAGVTYVNVITQSGRALTDFEDIKSFTAVANTPANGVTITIPAGALQFRSATLTSGTPVIRAISAPISLVISSGSTLGAVSAVASRIAVLAIDNAGTVEVAAVNMAGGVDLSETGLISTTAEGGAGAADSASVIYSTTARSNVAYRVIGVYDETQATAGTHVSALTLVQGAGGNVDIKTRSMVRLNTANGYGSTNTRIRRFTNLVKNQGDDITYADSATLGALFTINEAGVYAISYSENFTNAYLGVSLNSTQLTTDITAITTADVLTIAFTAISNGIGAVAWTGYLLPGDLIRPHGNAAAAGATPAQFTIARVG
jgi:hypothetical protein